MDLNKKRFLLNEFYLSQFNYSPLVRMFHKRAINNKINRLNERCLRLIYNDKQSSLEKLSEKNNTVSIHHRNLRTLSMEMFKVFKGLIPILFNETFPVRYQIQYNLRNTSFFDIHHR